MLFYPLGLVIDIKTLTFGFTVFHFMDIENEEKEGSLLEFTFCLKEGWMRYDVLFMGLWMGD